MYGRQEIGRETELVSHKHNKYKQARIQREKKQEKGIGKRKGESRKDVNIT